MGEKGFFAYGSTPTSSGECIEEAIKIINSSHEVELSSWKQLKISGKYLISSILDAIDNCDFFCADITNLNNNVLFELGYAISREKVIFLINDPSQIESMKRYKELGLLTTFGYSRYSKTDDIVREFAKERPFDSLDGNLWKNLVSNIDVTENKSAVLILNGQVDTNFNQEVINKAKAQRLPYILDDASESKVLPLNWYIQQLYNAPSFLAQFSSTTRAGCEIHNSKCALISGLALGRDLKIKMVAERPYDSPIDYKDLLTTFTFRPECGNIVEEFFKKIQTEIGELMLKKLQNKEVKLKRSELQKINFGEAIAEHESNNLFEYFVESATINNLIKNEYNIVVGRKGSGKTATLYYLNSFLKQDKRNHVILIKPINFEVDGLITLMETTKDDFERGFLIECIWKFLIFSEIAKFFYEEITAKGQYARTKDENTFVEYIDANASLFLVDFSTRLEEQLKVLKEKKIAEIESGNNNEFRLKVSEYLHQSTLVDLRSHFAKIVPKNHSIIVLIDNLDKSWRDNSKVTILSKYILGLLGLSGRIVKELQVIKNIPTGLSFHLTLFLRSDIFRYIKQIAREPDKIEVTKLRWDDKEVLFRIIEERFISLSDQSYTAEELWSRFIVDKIDGVDTKNYIMNIIFPRPRDIIFLFKSAKDTAVSRGHKKIEADDLKSAYKDYSAWIFTSMIVENGITEKQMEDFMYELMASNMIISRDEISAKMRLAKISYDTPEELDKFINHLIDLTILGREVRENEFEFEYDMDISKKISDKFGSNRFKIHNALIPFLECTI